jgi:hypothetical protein
MTTAIEHDDRPPAAGSPGGVPAGARSRRSMLALAAVESGRLLRHPAVLAATALSAWLLWRWGRGTAPVLHYADIATQVPLAPLAGRRCWPPTWPCCARTVTAPSTSTAPPG